MRDGELLTIHKNVLVFYCKNDGSHYRLNENNIENIIFDYTDVKVLFGLRTKTVDRITINVKDEEIPFTGIEFLEGREADFKRYYSKLRSFAEDNKIPFEISRRDEEQPTVRA